jgi:hypothetical protein
VIQHCSRVIPGARSGSRPMGYRFVREEVIVSGFAAVVLRRAPQGGALILASAACARPTFHSSDSCLR